MDFLPPELLDFAQSCWAFISSNALRVAMYFKTTWTNPSSAFWVPYIGAFFVWAALAFKRSYGGEGFRNFLRFCFPKEMYLHKSTATDIQVFLMNMFFRLPTVLLAGFGAPVIAAALLGLDWGTVKQYPLDPWTSLLFWIVWMLTAELGYYGAHRMYHQVPLFWEFHKVHHSAEVLTPITTFRTHPMFDAASGVFVAVVRGFILAGIVAAFGIQFSAVHLLGFNLFNATFQLFGKHLRHSHIWWAWGPRLTHVFLCPAQHQIHHSRDPKHANKNYGEMLALWDWLFGSLYIAREKEDLQFGIDEPHAITNGVTAYVMPFVGVWRMCARGMRRLVRAT
jgi:sterol desaturase/sphingolipid hydroxylase (fatty acid hydroxylase superfamily)